MRPPQTELPPPAAMVMILTGLLAAGTIPLLASKEAHLSPENQPITPEIFQHLVQLAQFDLSEEQSEYLRQQLNDQLKSIRQLEAIEIEPGVDITSHGVPYGPDIRPTIRADEVKASGLADDILEQGPDREDRYIVVPDIPHEELE